MTADVWVVWVQAPYAGGGAEEQEQGGQGNRWPHCFPLTWEQHRIERGSCDCELRNKESCRLNSQAEEMNSLTQQTRLEDDYYVASEKMYIQVIN